MSVANSYSHDDREFEKECCQVKVNGPPKTVEPAGIVRLTGLELADRKRSRPSRGELTPFSERGGAVLLEGIAAVEVAVLVEVIVDRGMGGGKFLQGLYISEIRHRSFSSSERLVGILGSIVEPPTALLIASIADYLHRRSVRPKPIGYS